MYIIIEHFNGEYLSDPFLVYNENDTMPFRNGSFLIFSLDDLTNHTLSGVSVFFLREVK